MSGTALRGRPGPRRWSDDELARLNVLLDRERDGRIGNLPALAIATGRSVSAIATKLTELRRARQVAAVRAACLGR